MAVTTEGSFSNSHSGYAMSHGGVTRFDLDATPKRAIGHKLEMQNGDIYRYSHFGADTNRGVLAAGDASESSITDSDNLMIAPASATDTSDGTIGSKFIQITQSGITAGQFEGGRLITTDDTGEGYTY